MFLRISSTLPAAKRISVIAHRSANDKPIVIYQVLSNRLPNGKLNRLLCVRR